MLKNSIKNLSILLLLLVAISCNNSPRNNMPQTGNFGAQVSESNVVSVTDVLKLLETNKEINVTVTGKISEFCKGEGCWITLENNGGEPLFVETENKSFVLPNNITGKIAVVAGKAYITTNTDGKAEPIITANGIIIK